MNSKRAAVVAFIVVAAGCGGRGKGVVGIRLEPWDRAIVAPATPSIPADWAEGEVIEVSPGGLSITVKVSRGEVRGGERVNVFVKPSVDPGPHYLADEVREIRAVAGKIVRVSGQTFQAEILDAGRRAPVEAGDRVMIRTP